jgi:prolyl oligopeptidase
MVGDPDRDEAYFAFTSFTVPTQVYQASIEQAARACGRRSSCHRHEPDAGRPDLVHSKDGTKVSMFVVHRAGIPLDGSHPTLLYGYGGFNIDMTPAFSALAAVWLEHGGVVRRAQPARRR